MSVSQANLSALRSVWERTDVYQSLTEARQVAACGISFDGTAVVRSEQVADLLQQTAQQAGLKQAISELFAGAHINLSENRPALHMALRDPSPDYGLADDAIDDIFKARQQMAALTDSLHSGLLPSGEQIKDVIHVGIGGSDLSTRLLTRALGRSNRHTPDIHFISAPATYWSSVAERLNPATTLLIATSKSFTTAETLYNLAMITDWQNQQGYRLAVTANPEQALQHGFNQTEILPLWPWVGGRYGFSSAASLAAAVSMGNPDFQSLLAGAHAMDQHFQHTPLIENLPVWMALIDLWQHVAGPYQARGVFTYDPRLSVLTSWLQQLETESNGKSVTATGEPLNMPGAPLVFGGDGSDAQHALYQMLHQGQTTWPLEFVGVRPQVDNPTSQLLFAQLQGQAETFTGGDQNAPAHARLPGKRPVCITLLDQLDAWHVGALLAAYEHKTFCFGRLIGCNPFDQWGVEAGKRATRAALKKS